MVAPAAQNAPQSDQPEPSSARPPRAPCSPLLSLAGPLAAAHNSINSVSSFTWPERPYAGGNFSDRSEANLSRTRSRAHQKYPQEADMICISLSLLKNPPDAMLTVSALCCKRPGNYRRPKQLNAGRLMLSMVAQIALELSPTNRMLIYSSRTRAPGAHRADL